MGWLGGGLSFYCLDLNLRWRVSLICIQFIYFTLTTSPTCPPTPSPAQEDQVCRFTADKREWLPGPAARVCVTTYTMVAYSGRRAEESERVMAEIMGREWGLLILDEVHVVPAAMFRRVLGIVKAHAKLGLTATLVREDRLIADLNFLIGGWVVGWLVWRRLDSRLTARSCPELSQ